MKQLKFYKPIIGLVTVLLASIALLSFNQAMSNKSSGLESIKYGQIQSSAMSNTDPAITNLAKNKNRIHFN